MTSFMENTYGLKESPFKQRSALWEQVETWVDREQEVKQWNRLLEDSISTPSANFLCLIVGDYGMGKSLSLFKIIKSADSTNNHFSVYMNLLSEQKPTKPGLDFLLRIFRHIDFTKIRVKQKELSVLTSINKEMYTILSKILFENDPDKKGLALDYLQGNISPSQNDLKNLGIRRKMADVDIAIEYLIGILFLIKQSGYPNFVIALDEFEYLFSLVPKNSQPIYLALLRRLYDLRSRIPLELRDITSNITIFIAISADGERRLNEIQDIEQSTGGPSVPLKRRIGANIITLTALPKEAAIQLIEKRLKLNRATKKFDREPLIPFTDEFAFFIYQISDGRPETILDRCEHVLDAGLEQRIPLLTKEFAIEVFKDRGIDSAIDQ